MQFAPLCGERDAGGRAVVFEYECGGVAARCELEQERSRVFQDVDYRAGAVEVFRVLCFLTAVVNSTG